MERFANAFSTTLTAAIDTAATSIAVATAAPAALQGGEFRILVGAAGGEIMLVTATGSSGASPWTVQRAAEIPSVAMSHASGATVEHVLTAASLSEAVGSSSTPDADATTKGKLQLAGDLGGTAASPTVPGLAAKAPLASPTFTGDPRAPTPAPGDNDTSIATSAFVKAALDALVAAAPGTLDTLDELAAALGDDANFAATITTALAAKAAKASNLSDLASTATARTNLGLGDAATHAAADFTAAGASTVSTTVAGNLGATYTLVQTVGERALEGTLNANCALTWSGWPAGYSHAVLSLKQDATGGRTFSVNGTSVPLLGSLAAANAVVEIELRTYDGGSTITIGRPGADGATGAAGLTWRDAWVSGTTYAVNDAVTNAGSSYRRLVAGAGTTAPGSDPTNWAPIAAKGDTGAAGTNGSPAFPQRYAVGEYYSTLYSTYQNAAGNTDQAMYVPFTVDETQTFDRIAVYVSIVGGAGSTARLGIHSDTAGKPGALILDAGTVTTDTLALRTITINQSLVPGRYWLACQNNHVTTAPNYVQINQPASCWMATNMQPRMCWIRNSATGALAANPTGLANSTNGIIVGLRAA